MNEEKEPQLKRLNEQSINAVNSAMSLHHEVQELHRSIEKIRSIHEIDEIIESITILSDSIRTTEQNLKGLRARFCI